MNPFPTLPNFFFFFMKSNFLRIEQQHRDRFAWHSRHLSWKLEVGHTEVRMVSFYCRPNDSWCFQALFRGYLISPNNLAFVVIFFTPTLTFKVATSFRENDPSRRKVSTWLSLVRCCIFVLVSFLFRQKNVVCFSRSNSFTFSGSFCWISSSVDEWITNLFLLQT